MSKAPYRHGDGSDCYTINCSRGHYTSADAAVSKRDINAFLDAKLTENNVQTKSLEEMGFVPRTSLDTPKKNKESKGFRKVLKTLGVAAGAAGLAVMLSACSPSSLTSGTIDSKNYHEAYTSIISVCGGKPTSCHPVIQHHPEKWTVTFENHNQKGELETRTINVDENTYGKVEVGQEYKMTPEQISAGQADAAWGTGLWITGGVVGAGVLSFLVYNQVERHRDRKFYEEKYGRKPSW